MPSVTCARSTGLTSQQVRESRLYVSYLNSLEADWQLLGFHVTWAAARVENKGTEYEHKDIILMFAEIEVRDADRRIIKSGSWLRGETVEILPILIDPDGNYHTAFVSQARVPVGCTVKSTPAGMVDGNSKTVTVFKELEEELGRPVVWSEPVWLNEPITGSSDPLFVSPGGSSEAASYCFMTTEVSFEELDGFRGNTAGNLSEGEQTTTSIAPLDELPGRLSYYGVRDCKTLQLILMYTYYRYMRGALE